MRLNKGFTIIELLIVIVIIGILVAITAVSYTGITNGANTSKNQANARSVQQAALACHAKNGSFPALTVAGINGCGAGMTIPTGVTVGTPASTDDATKKNIGLSATGSTLTVTYFDYSSGSVATL